MKEELVQKIARYYRLGLYEIRHLERLAQTGKLTEAQKREILEKD